jgi:hypothetical protein
MSALAEIFDLYRMGFRSMVLGRTLWKIVIIKLIIMFGVLKLFFFPNYLRSNFTSDQERASHVLESITKPYLPRALTSDRYREAASPGLMSNNHSNRGR